jgi:hypothetical protein
MLAAGLGLVASAGCIGDLDVGKKPMLDQASTGGGSESTDDGGPGMTSSPTADATAGSTDDGGSTDDTTTGGPPEISPPCELGGPGPGHDPAVQWGVVCGGSMQEVVQAIAIDGTGAIYVSTQVEGWVPTTVVVGDDEIPSSSPPTLLITKLGPDGQILWSRSFIGESTWWYGGSIAVCGDRVIVVANRSGPPETIDFGTGIVDGNMAVVAFDLDGQTQWAMATGQDDAFSGGYPVGAVSCRGDGVVIRGATAVDLVLDDVMLDGDVSTVDHSYVVVLDNDGNASWGMIEPKYSTVAALGPMGELVTFGHTAAGLALTRYAADGTPTWQHEFAATGPNTLSGIAIDDAGAITLSGSFGDQLDFGLGALVNGDPPDDPLDPTDDWLKQDGFVSHHDASGVVQWNVALAELGYDYVMFPRLAADGTPQVLWSAEGSSRLVAVDAAGVTDIAVVPGDYVRMIAGDPSGGLALGWNDPATILPFDPPLTARGGLDLTITRLTP